MTQLGLTTSPDGIGWTDLYEGLANAVNSYSDPQLHGELLDLLGEALDECTLSFPIVNSGEELNSLDPFTFFSAFNWSYSSEQRVALIFELVKLLEVEDYSELPGVEGNSRLPVEHGFFVKERELRFFTFSEKNMQLEIHLLWTLFSASLAFADVHNEQEQTLRDKSEHALRDESARALFSHGYDNVLNQRVKGAHLITTALHWVRPKDFLPVNERMGSYLAQELGYAAEFFTETPKAAAYIQYLDDCRQAVSGGCFGESVKTLSDLAESALRAAEPDPPHIDEEKTKSFLLECRGKLGAIHRENVQLWRAVRCFQENWNPEAEDFADMLKASLAQHGSLLASSNIFNPYKEVMVFARKEPDIMRQAFAGLFDASAPLTVRLLRFEEITATCYTRYREHMLRAYAKRSAHGNFTTLATYIFLRYPDSSYLYSPVRINAIAPKLGYSGVIRVARPESVEEYYDLCNQIKDLVTADTELMSAHAKLICSQDEYVDPAHHLLVEDIIRSTL